MKASVLCVDDDPSLLKGLALNLGRRYEVKVAGSAEAALAVLTREGPFAAVVSDMRMPGLDGAHFLACVRSKWPDTVRLLLTGQADSESAIRAVNNGQIFRFLTKPCAPADLSAAVQAAVDQHALLVTEKDLLERTVKGSIEALVSVLALSHPEAFGRGQRLRGIAAELGRQSGMASTWAMETAALLSPIGLLDLPEEIGRKLGEGARLEPSETALVQECYRLSRKIVSSIPRLEPVLAIMDAWQDPGGGPAASRQEADILRLVGDFDDMENRGLSAQSALDLMRGQPERYAAELVARLAAGLGKQGQDGEVADMPIARLQPGMIFVQALRSRNGALLVARGFVATESLLGRLRNLPKEALPESIAVRLPAAQGNGAPGGSGS